MAAQRIGAQNLLSQLPRAECPPTGLWKRGTHNSVQQMLHHASCSLWIALWDFMTSPGRRQCSPHHVHLITFLSWNTSGRELLSSATDWNFILWDVVSGEVGFFGSVSPPSGQGDVPHLSNETCLHTCDVEGGGTGTCPY